MSSRNRFEQIAERLATLHPGMSPAEAFALEAKKCKLPMARPRDPKRRTAAAMDIKAAAMRVIDSEGATSVSTGIVSIEAEHCGLQIMYTPNAPGFTSKMIESARRNGVTLPPDAPRMLDIWQGTKVFSLRWNDAGFIEIVNFKRGTWEALLI